MFSISQIDEVILKEREYAKSEGSDLYAESEDVIELLISRLRGRFFELHNAYMDEMHYQHKNAEEL